MTTPLYIDMPRVVVNEFHDGDLYDLEQIFVRMTAAGQPWFNAGGWDPDSVNKFLKQALDNQQDEPRHTYRMAIRHKEEDGGERLIGYVSLCKVFGCEEGIPDTGIFVDPLFQRGGYAREARLGIMMFAFWMGITKIYCDIAQENTPSQNNVLGMGYQQHFEDDNTPKLIPTDTLNGVEDWFRYSLDRNTFFDKIPHLVAGMQPKWPHIRASLTEEFSHAVSRFAAETPCPQQPWQLEGLFSIKHGSQHPAFVS